MNKEPVYIIIPVHNRKETTIKCLNNLKENGDLDPYYVVVVDDGSTDGTSEAIQLEYPEIIILQGDGNLWWTGGIKKGMEYAYQQDAEYFIWLNDDCYPLKKSISKLLEFCRSHPQTIAGGHCIDPDNLHPSYGGILAQKGRIKPIYATENIEVKCDGLAGNFACISSQVVTQIGYPDSINYPQYYGDVTYTHNAKKQGYNLLVYQGASAYCKNDHPVISWLIPDRPLLDYWQDYFTIKSPFYWKAELNYYREMLGTYALVIYFYQRIIKLIIFMVINLIIPLQIRKKIKRLPSSNIT